MVYSICVIALGGFAFYSTAFLRKGSGCFYVWSAKGTLGQRVLSPSIREKSRKDECDGNASHKAGWVNCII